MKILKASAGSGKTFRLANTYIDLLLSSGDRYAYRHILAVTFTNKATAEMKARILKELSKRAVTDERARQMLTDILHDYSAFSISTIDKFFQQALKAFAREIGQFSAYQIDLDRKSLIDESMDRILDSLTEDKKDLLEWIKGTLRETLENGEKFSIENKLYEIGAQLKSEEHRALAEKLGIDDRTAFSKDRLDDIRKACRNTIKSFEDRAGGLGIFKDRKTGKIKVPGKKALEANAALQELFDKPYVVYNTARKIESLIFCLGLAGEFYNEFDALLKEKNVMCLDESNTILKQIIDGSDAPFVYEKLGVRYEHFLLDEFQDTSGIQWENFLPLLRESESRGGRNLIVGDVKQSIYRWRNSDWRLLDSGVSVEFPAEEPETMTCNWRSCSSIVSFNNRFFPFAATAVGAERIYADVRQEIRTRDTAQPGQVRISFTDDIDAAVLDSISDARSRGARWSDIAVQIRYKNDGSHLAAYLITQGIPVISDDSLKVKSSITVRRAVSLLTFIDNPEDSVGSFLARSLGVDFPTVYHSLIDLTEGIMRSLKSFDQEVFDGETLFIEAFLDDLQSWTETGGNDLRGFLRHWKDNDPCISSPSGVDAIRIITVHKSKGLQFPYVIFPYADTVELYRHGKKWCSMDADGTPLGDSSSGIYPVDLTEDTYSSLFREAYEEERRMQAVDNLNIFYVSLTRAEKTLHVISARPSASFLKTVDRPAPQYKHFSEILYRFIGKMDEYSEGEPYDFNRMEREDGDSVENFPATFESIPLSSRLQPSADASDFFGEDGLTGSEASPRLGGVVLHDILSSVLRPSDLKAATDAAIMDGKIGEEEGRNAFSLLQNRISKHMEWFPDSPVKVRTELSIFGADGSENRPDRVVYGETGVTIIDYKFGEHHLSHEKQVRRYMDLYRKMGYAEVHGYLWYVREDEVIAVG